MIAQPKEASGSYVGAATILTPLLFFALPLGMGNEAGQITAGALLAPFLFAARGSLLIPIVFTLFISIVSVFQVAMAAEHDYSMFQFTRAALPLVLGCVFLVGYDAMFRRFQLVMKNTISVRVLHGLMTAFAIGQLVQIIGFIFGLGIANSQFGSDDESRVFLFPHAATLLIFFYACDRRKLLLIGLTAVVLMASGAKTDVMAMLALGLLAFAKHMKKTTGVLNVAVIVGIVGAAVYSNSNAVDRLLSFVTQDQARDGTREIEIQFARYKFLSGFDKIVIGNGLATPVGPGIASIDPRWSENSRFDIENGYWGMLVKLGIVGTAAYVSLFSFLPRDRITLAVVIIELVTAFGSSYLIFDRYECVYLLLWSVVIRSIVLRGDAPTVTEAASQFGVRGGRRNRSLRAQAHSR